MTSAKGKPRGKPFTTAGPGRPKGSKNKVPQEVRAMLREALDGVGGADYLMDQARKNPTAFMQLVGKLIPSEVKATVTTKTWEELITEATGNEGA